MFYAVAKYVLVFRGEDKKTISQIYGDGKNCGQISDRMSGNDKKLPCLN